jgi:hypothetical protein
MRAHPCLPALLQVVDKQEAASFTRATNDALELLARGGFDLEEGFWVAGYLLQGAIGLVAGHPGGHRAMTPAEAAEFRRQKRLNMEKLPPAECATLVEFAKTLEREPDIQHYYQFGIDLLMSGVAATAATRAPRPSKEST